MVGSWLWQGLIGRFSTVFDRVDIWLMFTCGWWGPWAEEEAEVAQERVDVSLQIMAQYRSFALLITRVTLLLTPLQTSPHKRCLCCPSLTIQIRSKAHTHQQTLWRKLCTNAFTHDHTPTHTHKLEHRFAFTHIHNYVHTGKFTHAHCRLLWSSLICTNLYTTKLLLDICIIIKHLNYIHNSSFKRKDHIHPNGYPYYQWKTYNLLIDLSFRDGKWHIQECTVDCFDFYPSKGFITNFSWLWIYYWKLENITRLLLVNAKLIASMSIFRPLHFVHYLLLSCP